MASSFSLMRFAPQVQAANQGLTLSPEDPATGITYVIDPQTGARLRVFNDPSRTGTLGPIIKGLAIGGVGAGLGAAGLAALGGGGSGVLGGLGLTSGAPETLGSYAFGPEVLGEGAGALGAAAPENVLITGSLAGAGGYGGATLPAWAAPALGVGAGAGIGLAAAGGGGGSGATGYDSSGNPTYKGGTLTNPTDVQSAILNSSDPFSTANLLKYGALGVGGASLLSGELGGGLGTTTTTQNLSPQQLAYQQIQQQIAEKQLQLLNSQGDFQGSYLDSIRPLLDQQAKLMQQQYDAFDAAQNDPLNKQLQQQASDLLGQQISSQNSLAPLQQQLLEAQLKQAISGGNATPEQLAAIDAATKAAYDTGTSDINAFASDSLNKLGQELAPGLGLRPTDTPIQDRAALVAREATRQAGQLTSNLAGVNANARINLPLAQQQIGNATASNTANIASAAQKFQADLAQQAITNRLNLLGAGRSATDLGLTSGSNLVSASRGNPLTYGGSTTTSNPSAGLSSTLGGLGGLLTGLNSIGLGFA